jgi:hypothetical protein
MNQAIAEIGKAYTQVSRVFSDESDMPVAVVYRFWIHKAPYL